MFFFYIPRIDPMQSVIKSVCSYRIAYRKLLKTIFCLPTFTFASSVPSRPIAWPPKNRKNTFELVCFVSYILRFQKQTSKAHFLTEFFFFFWISTFRLRLSINRWKSLWNTEKTLRVNSNLFLRTWVFFHLRFVRSVVRTDGTSTKNCILITVVSIGSR